MPKSRKDLFAGLIFMAFGIAFGATAWTYSLGTALRMGPGYFPLVLGAALALLGALITAGALKGGDEKPLGPIPWRGILLLTAAVLFFGFSVRRLGLVPALFVASFLAALSSTRTTIVAALVMAVALTVFCVLIFVEALGMPVPLFGTWLRF
jgi:hypothetical protein